MFALTPALSPMEREERIQPNYHSGTLDCAASEIVEPTRRGAAGFPLSGGEGLRVRAVVFTPPR